MRLLTTVADQTAAKNSRRRALLRRRGNDDQGNARRCVCGLGPRRRPNGASARLFGRVRSRREPLLQHGSKGQSSTPARRKGRRPTEISHAKDSAADRGETEHAHRHRNGQLDRHLRRRVLPDGHGQRHGRGATLHLHATGAGEGGLGVRRCQRDLDGAALAFGHADVPTLRLHAHPLQHVVAEGSRHRDRARILLALLAWLRPCDRGVSPTCSSTRSPGRRRSAACRAWSTACSPSSGSEAD